MAAPSDFLAALFGATFPGDGLRASLWTKNDKTSHYLDAPVHADKWAGAVDVYVAACLTTSTAPNRRLKARDARAIPGVWLDVDLPGPEDPHGKKPARDREQAIGLVNAVLEPTVLVNSGYGVQAWWLLEKPWVFGSEAEHQQAARVEHGWELLHRDHARRAGFNIDSVHDLARVMRLPGTRNGKGDGADVEVISWDGPRYTVDRLSGPALSVAVPDKANGAAPDVNLDAAFPMLKFDALRENMPVFKATWEHQRRDRSSDGWSTSEYDLSLATFAARAGWTDDEITALIVAHRQKYEGADSEKAKRAKYIADTILKARSGIQREERAETRDNALETLAAIGDSPNGHVDSGTVLSHFNTVVSGGIADAPVFKELVQYGTDPDSARFVLVTDSGHEVNIGPYAFLRQPRRLDERIGPATGFVMETVKDNDTWRAALRALFKVRQIREEPEEPVVEWARRYLEDRLGADRNKACQARAPFDEEGWVYVRVDELGRFVKGVLKQNVRNEADLKPLLRRAGFEEKTVHYQRKSGSRSTAAYWRIKQEEIE